MLRNTPVLVFATFAPIRLFLTSMAWLASLRCHQQRTVRAAVFLRGLADRPLLRVASRIDRSIPIVAETRLLLNRRISPLNQEREFLTDRQEPEAPNALRPQPQSPERIEGRRAFDLDQRVIRCWDQGLLEAIPHEMVVPTAPEGDENEKLCTVAHFSNHSGGGDRRHTFAVARLYAAGLSRCQESGHHCALDGLAI
jgi:hypothetical protein